MSTTEALMLNPFEPGFFDDPYAQYSRLREHEPVHQSTFGPCVLFAYDDVLALLRDPALSVEERHVAPTEIEQARRALFEQLGDDIPSTREHSMLDLDPPDHDRLRRLVAKAFNPSVVRALRPRVQELVDEALDRMAVVEAPDVIRDLAFPLPFAVISEMLGMPDAERDQLREWSHAMTKTLDPIISEGEVRAAFDAATYMTEHVSAVIESKRRAPADDLLSALIAAEDDGDVLTHDELLAQVLLLYVAGHETTVNLIGNGTLALLRHPEQLTWLREHPERDQDAIEELLRFDGPVQFSRRVTLEPLEIRGVLVPGGSLVLTCLGSANRDPTHFGPDADSLHLDRDGAAHHVAFGSGIHHCLGAALARVESQVAIGSLARRFPRLAREDPHEAPAWNGRMVLRGLDRLPVRVR